VHIRHLLQLSVKLTLLGRPLQPLKQLAQLSAIKHAGALQGYNGHALTICELSYWNGMVLNVAHRMIATSNEFMHESLSRPERPL
jgi:hypothetical protein